MRVRQLLRAMCIMVWVLRRGRVIDIGTHESSHFRVISQFIRHGFSVRDAPRRSHARLLFWNDPYGKVVVTARLLVLLLLLLLVLLLALVVKRLPLERSRTTRRFHDIRVTEKLRRPRILPLLSSRDNSNGQGSIRPESSPCRLSSPVEREEPTVCMRRDAFDVLFSPIGRCIRVLISVVILGTSVVFCLCRGNLSWR